MPAMQWAWQTTYHGLGAALWTHA